MLCFRCEHRARFLEDGVRPRFECGETARSNIGCYMFTPCRPIVMSKVEGDPRSAHGGYFGARMRAERIADDCVLINTKKGWLAWTPK